MLATIAALMLATQAAPAVETETAEPSGPGLGGPWRGIEADLRMLFFLQQTGIDLGPECLLVTRPDLAPEAPGSEVRVRRWSTPGSSVAVRSSDRALMPEAMMADCLAALERRDPGAFDRLMLAPRPDLRPLMGEAGLDAQLLGGPESAVIVADPTEDTEPTARRTLVPPR
jgi:hypothetical protein